MSGATAKILTRQNAQTVRKAVVRPVLLLTIANGAAHTRAAEAIAAAWRAVNSEIPVRVVEISDFMSPLARFTHISAYLWLVKNAPAIWEKIDAFQKRQTGTSPEWFYRRECRKLFELAREIKPSAIVATEVGCGEIAALIKRDLNLDISLVAVSLDYDADLAWIKPEVDLYCLASETVRSGFEQLGAPPEKIRVFGVPMQNGFNAPNEFERKMERLAVCDELNLKTNAPLVLVAGGGEGMGKIELIVRRLLELENAQIVVMTGRNQNLKAKCERLAQTVENAARLRVLGWTNQIPRFFRAADLLVSKLGNTFDQAMACALPIVSLVPPPGAERVQFELLEKWNVGRKAGSLAEMKQIVGDLLDKAETLAAMRIAAEKLSRTDAAEKIAAWLGETLKKTVTAEFE